MKPILGKSIRLFLMDGVSDGRWICELSNWTGKAYKIPRSMLGQSKNREDLQSTGLYLLLGRNDELGGKDRVYIGEAENIYERLKQHAAGKDFWFEVIVYLSKDEHLNKAHIKYLESRLYEISQKVDRFVVENTSTPTRSKISEAEQAEMEEFLQHIVMLTSILGHKVFESIEAKTDNLPQQKFFFIHSSKGAYAKGKTHPEGFIVYQDSKLSHSITTSFQEHSFNKLRQHLVDEKIIEQNIFMSDYIFNSPSAAAAVILGRSANGLTSWKTQDGIELKSIEDQS